MFIGNPLESEYAFPVLEVTHIIGYVLAIGTVAVVDFRMLGLGLRRMSPIEMTKGTRLWTALGLTLAILFHYTIHRKTVNSGGSGIGAKLVACVSLALWVSVVWGGIWIAFVKEGLDFN
jgi:hypothetical protein